jgi:hypothetical protein
VMRSMWAFSLQGPKSLMRSPVTTRTTMCRQTGVRTRTLA